MTNHKPNNLLRMVEIPPKEVCLFLEAIAEENCPEDVNKVIARELDLVVGEQLASEQQYWPLIKSAVDVNNTSEYTSKEKYLAMVAYAIHKHFPFENRLEFVAEFCNRSIDVIKNHIAFRYKYYNWFIEAECDMGGTDYEIESEISEYFAKYYELKDPSEF